jgi:uncharacterized DUF497 family protein
MNDIPSKLGIPDREFRVAIGSTKVDYDPNKEESNRKKHGYSLESAVEQLEHLILPVGKPRPYMVSDGFQEGGEVRHMHTGIDDTGTVILFVTTMRPSETVRIISYRRASNEDRELFFQHTGYREE